MPIYILVSEHLFATYLGFLRIEATAAWPAWHESKPPLLAIDGQLIYPFAKLANRFGALGRVLGGSLTGIRGTFKILIEGGKHLYDFEYELPS